ncbi:MAG TPA: tRNA (adenosine(37)-N6)-dimethylallyltransferase MiaA, partial [Rhodospirillaceae bacterium]|nr:tRNA (adenosine(37)-N6)-dimethylallyltransferase MiaA [Rhodospirillaceae bacterium]
MGLTTLNNAPLVVIGGPTASGKSALALALAREFDGVVINADSMQVYDALPILTARPGAAEQALAPHRLYGVLAADDRCSAGRWQAMAAAECRAAWAD